MILKKIYLIILLMVVSSLKAQTTLYCNQQVKVGIENHREYLPMLKNKTVGVVVN